MVKRLPLTIIAVSILFYILFAVLSKATSLDAEKITLAYIPLLFLLTSTGYLIRLARWLYFLRITGTGVDMKRNVLIFFAGLVASITPAKAGEIVKSGFLAKWHPVAKTAPLVVAERGGDVVGLITLCLISSVSVLKNGAFLLILLIFLLFLFLLRIHATYAFISKRLPSRFSQYVMHIQSSFLSLFSFEGLVVTLLSSTCCWFFECLTLYFTVTMLGASLHLLDAIFIFSFSTLLGAASLLPGGLGVSEASIFVLLTRMGIPSPEATSASLISRIATLWFGVFLGGCALLLYARIDKG
jgi:uncharacterized protein (TIRG00374 family)